MVKAAIRAYVMPDFPPRRAPINISIRVKVTIKTIVLKLFILRPPKIQQIFLIKTSIDIEKVSKK